MIKCIQACGGEYAGLAPTTAQPLAHYSGPRDVLGAAHQHGSDRSSETLGEADADRVEQAPISLECHPRCNMRIPEAGPIEVIADAMLTTQLSHRCQLIEGLDRAAAKVVGVLHGDRGCRY